MEQSASFNINLGSTPLRSMKPLETAYLETVQGWKKACAQLASSVEMYLNACFTLGTACLDLPDTFKNTPLVLQTLDDIDKEIHRMASDWPKLFRAQAAMNAARNHSPKLVPINALPREVLSHIFHLVVTSEFWYGSPVGAEYDYSTANSKIELPEYPSNLSKVCSFWHQLVENTPTLWSHIHLVVSGVSKDAFFARASHLVKRAANTPLFICIHEPRKISQDTEQLTSWLAPVISKIYRLELSRRSTTPKTLDSVLRCWLECGTPGTVKELSLQSTPLHPPALVELVSGSKPRFMQFNVSPERFADFLRPVTLLRLTSVLLPWNIRGFCGLQHLRLAKGTITEAQFIAILSENRQLRTLAFGLSITEAQPRDILQTPVHLSELEILKIDVTLMPLPTAIWPVLRLLAPGARPLRMAFKLGNATRLHKLTEPEEEAFFQRSNVTVCYLEANYDSDSPWFSTMARKLPYLHTLCVANTSFPGRSPSHKSDPDGINHVCSPLRELTLINYGFALADFKKLLRAHSIQVLRLWDCYAFLQGGRSHEETGNLEEELSELVPNVRTYYGSNGDSSPYSNWGYVQF